MESLSLSNLHFGALQMYTYSLVHYTLPFVSNTGEALLPCEHQMYYRSPHPRTKSCTRLSAAGGGENTWYFFHVLVAVMVLATVGSLSIYLPSANPNYRRQVPQISDIS